MVKTWQGDFLKKTFIFSLYVPDSDDLLQFLSNAFLPKANKANFNGSKNVFLHSACAAWA